MTASLDNYQAIKDGSSHIVRLSRPGGADAHYDWVTHYEGLVRFEVQDLPPVKSGCQARPAGHKAFYLSDHDDWAEMSTLDYTDGALVVEDYMLELLL